MNYNFQMNIQHYIMVNFKGVAAIVDSLGGVDLDLTKGEAANINYYLKKKECCKKSVTGCIMIKINNMT